MQHLLEILVTNSFIYTQVWGTYNIFYFPFLYTFFTQQNIHGTI